MKKIIMTAALIAAAAGGACAQTPAVENADSTLIRTDAPAVDEKGEAQWFINMDYAGFDFELPAGTVVQKGSSFVAKYPDGTFGISMSNVEKKGVNQKLAFEVCRRLATSMHMPNPHVEKVNFGKCGGAKASGMLEGQHVTVMVLPYNNQEVTTVILATPERQEWVDHFLKTLKR